MSERQRWACPDLGVRREPGRELPVPGSQHVFDFCPAAYLRTAEEVALLNSRRDSQAWAEHLIGGAVHPAETASTDAYEVEQGARTFDSLPTKRQELSRLYLTEKGERDRYEMELRREAKHADQR